MVLLYKIRETTSLSKDGKEEKNTSISSGGKTITKQTQKDSNGKKQSFYDVKLSQTKGRRPTSSREFDSAGKVKSSAGNFKGDRNKYKNMKKEIENMKRILSPWSLTPLEPFGYHESSSSRVRFSNPKRRPLRRSRSYSDFYSFCKQASEELDEIFRKTTMWPNWPSQWPDRWF